MSAVHTVWHLIVQAINQENNQLIIKLGQQLMNIFSLMNLPFISLSLLNIRYYFLLSTTQRYSVYCHIWWKRSSYLSDRGEGIGSASLLKKWLIDSLLYRCVRFLQTRRKACHISVFMRNLGFSVPVNVLVQEWSDFCSMYWRAGVNFNVYHLTSKL